MYKIGLTGNYLSGQNEVSVIFEKIGVKVFDADLILKYLINYSTPHIRDIKSNFGDNIYQMGLLNLNSFQDNKSWNKLIDLVEFDILKSYERFRLKYKDDAYTIFKYSYLFERQTNINMDYSISCHRPKSYRKEDMSVSTFLTFDNINKILDSEMDEYFKNKKSNFVISNYKSVGTMIELEKKVLSVHEKIIKKKPQDSSKNLGYEYSSGFWD